MKGKKSKHEMARERKFKIKEGKRFCQNTFDFDFKFVRNFFGNFFRK